MTSCKRVCKILDFTDSLSSYEEIWRYQKVLQSKCWNLKKRKLQTNDHLILTQHYPVYTIGRGGSIANLIPTSIQATKSKVFRVERGGEVTFHGPDQLVIYPILDLDGHKRDLHWLTRTLEDSVINSLRFFGVLGQRSSINTGVWVGKNKVCALGITASRWITMHGIAINIGTDLQYFKSIIPCGIPHEMGGVCSLNQITNSTINFCHFKDIFLKSFQEQFRLEYEFVDDPRGYLNSFILESKEEYRLEDIQL